MDTFRGVVGVFVVLFGVFTLVASLAAHNGMTFLLGWALACVGWWAGGLDRMGSRGY